MYIHTYKLITSTQIELGVGYADRPPSLLGTDSGPQSPYVRSCCRYNELTPLLVPKTIILSFCVSPLHFSWNYFGHLILILLIIVVQNLISNYRVLSLNNVLVNLEINIVHVTIFIVNCCVWDDDLYIVLSIVINCGLVRNKLVKLVKFMFCLSLLPFWWIKLNIIIYM